MRPALKQARAVVKEKFAENNISPYKLLSLIIAIFLCTWLFMRYLLRHVLTFILGKWSQQWYFSDVAKSNFKRVISLKAGTTLGDFEYIPSDQATNYISSTVFDSSSRVKLLVLSFVYGGLV